MTRKAKLSKPMSETQFDNGYWYADQIKTFAKEIGIPLTSKLRKGELEKLIKHFLRTGNVKGPARKNISRSGIEDLEKGQDSFRKIPVGRYINFIADYLAQEKNSTREQAIDAWKKLKKSDIPKYYRAWKKYYRAAK